MNIRKEIMEEWKDSFIASDEEQAYDAYPYNIKPFIHEEVTKFLSQALTRIEEKTREETIKGLRKTFDSDLQKAFEEKDIEKSSNAGYALGGFERATKLLLSPSDEKESHCVIREGYEMHAKDCHCSEEKEENHFVESNKKECMCSCHTDKKGYPHVEVACLCQKEKRGR